ncbi:MAG TPA: hypothetical protein VIL36_01885 [Acidimicrobiales bacterium]
MPFRRRLLICAVLALVVVVGAGFGRSAAVPAATTVPTVPGVPAATALAAPVTAAAGQATEAVDDGDDAGDDAGDPCVVRPECGGAWAFGVAGLLLAVVVTVPAVGGAPTRQRVVAAPAVLHPALLPSGLFRPPKTF